VAYKNAGQNSAFTPDRVRCVALIVQHSYRSMSRPLQHQSTHKYSLYFLLLIWQIVTIRTTYSQIFAIMPKMHTAKHKSC